MSGFRELFETMFSVCASVTQKGVESGGKNAMLSVARKIGWAKKAGPSSGGLHSHRLQGHSLGSGGSGPPRDMSNYDPKSEYASRTNALYEKSKFSGHGKTVIAAMNQSSGKSDATWLNRGTVLPSSRNVPQRQQPQQTSTLKSKLKF